MLAWDSKRFNFTDNYKSKEKRYNLYAQIKHQFSLKYNQKNSINKPSKKQAKKLIINQRLSKPEYNNITKPKEI